MSVAFGKIAKAIADLISHVGNTTSHITSSERSAWNGKAASSHKHSASDINSGTLAVARGGTGGTTPEKARKNLGVIEIITGTYTGSYSSSAQEQTINLGIDIKGVLVENEAPEDPAICYGRAGFAIKGNPYQGHWSLASIKVVDGGFSVGGDSYNKNGTKYNYIVWY